MRFGLMFMSVLLLTTLLVSIKRQVSDIALLAKTLLSTIFLLVALTTPHLNLTYSWGIIVALAFCLAGDISLAFDSKRAFLMGLGAFLTGHIAYIAIFTYMANVNLGSLIALGGAVFVSAIVYTWLKPHLNSMRRPVIAYIIVITLMVAAAGSMAGDNRFSTAGRWMVGCGAILFYLSDLFVARQQFIHSAFVNRAIGLPLYYAGQFLLAFSVGTIR